MKLQIEAQKLRVRIDEDELARLLDGHALRSESRFADAFSMQVELGLGGNEVASLSGQADAWRIVLPEVAVREHAARLPTREGLRYVVQGQVDGVALELLFDVDVRDSVRRRRPL